MQDVENAGVGAGASEDCSHSRLGHPEYRPPRRSVQPPPPPASGPSLGPDGWQRVDVVADRVAIATALKAIAFHLSHANLPDANAIRLRMGWSWDEIVGADDKSAA